MAAITVAFCVAVEATTSTYFDREGKLRMIYKPGSQYKIMHVTDLHLGESHEEDERTYSFLNVAMHKEQPDFVAITGDLVSGNRFH